MEAMRIEKSQFPDRPFELLLKGRPDGKEILREQITLSQFPDRPFELLPFVLTDDLVGIKFVAIL